MDGYVLEDVHSLTPELYAFILQAYQKLFGRFIGESSVPADLSDFEATYLVRQGRFILLRDSGEIVGIIGYRPFNRRFKNGDDIRSELEFRDQTAVEVVRLFVKETHRSRGLASKLIGELFNRAQEEEVDVMYLHTHPFLPGAQKLWEKHGWNLIVADEDLPWNTLHMSRDIRLQYPNKEKTGTSSFLHKDVVSQS
jgi:GNAT superfamily N-acetyltransferase